MKLPFFQFYPLDWLADTRKLSPLARATWIDILAHAWNAPERGIYELPIAAFCAELGLDFKGLKSVLQELALVGEVTLRDEKVTVKCRRMYKEGMRYKYHAIRQARYMERRRSDASVTPQTLEIHQETSKSLHQDKSKSLHQETPRVGRKHSSNALHKKTYFSKPTPEQIREYANGIGFSLDAGSFWDHYEANGWRVGRTPMKDWQAAVRTWRRNEYGVANSNGGNRGNNVGTGFYSDPVNIERLRAYRKAAGLRKVSEAAGREILGGARADSVDQTDVENNPD